MLTPIQQIIAIIFADRLIKGYSPHQALAEAERIAKEI